MKSVIFYQIKNYRHCDLPPAGHSAPRRHDRTELSLLLYARIILRVKSLYFRLLLNSQYLIMELFTIQDGS